VAMSRIGPVPIELVLPTGSDQPRRCDAHERDGRAIYEDTVLREPEDGGVFKSRGLGCESEAGSETDAGDGGLWGLSGSPHKPEPPGTFCVSVSARWGDDRAPEPRLERGHYLCSAGERVCVPGGNPGLVFSVCVVLSTLQQSGDDFGSGGRSDMMDREQAEHGARNKKSGSGTVKTRDRA